MSAYRAPPLLAKLAPRAPLWRRVRFVARVALRDFVDGVVAGSVDAVASILELFS